MNTAEEGNTQFLEFMGWITNVCGLFFFAAAVLYEAGKRTAEKKRRDVGEPVSWTGVVLAYAAGLLLLAAAVFSLLAG